MQKNRCGIRCENRLESALYKNASSSLEAQFSEQSSKGTRDLKVGATQPTVRWSRLRPLPQSAIVNDAFLVIQSIRPQDAGTYVSTVQNVVGTVEKRVSLFVRAKPVITGGTESLTAVA
ncbi:basement membrane-specific heparan sulfate proteoglycan core protein-like [Crassostrea virginica]